MAREIDCLQRFFKFKSNIDMIGYKDVITNIPVMNCIDIHQKNKVIINLHEIYKFNSIISSIRLDIKDYKKHNSIFTLIRGCQFNLGTNIHNRTFFSYQNNTNILHDNLLYSRLQNILPMSEPIPMNRIKGRMMIELFFKNLEVKEFYDKYFSITLTVHKLKKPLNEELKNTLLIPINNGLFWLVSDEISVHSSILKHIFPRIKKATTLTLPNGNGLEISGIKTWIADKEVTYENIITCINHGYDIIIGHKSYEFNSWRETKDKLILVYYIHHTLADAILGISIEDKNNDIEDSVLTINRIKVDSIVKTDENDISIKFNKLDDQNMRKCEDINYHDPIYMKDSSGIYLSIYLDKKHKRMVKYMNMKLDIIFAYYNDDKDMKQPPRLVLKKINQTTNERDN